MSSAKPQIKRTYGSRGARPALISSGSSDTSPSSSPPRETISTKPSSTLSNKRKRPLSDLLHPNVAPPSKKQQRGKSTAKKTTTLTQLHFITDTPILRTCPLCDLTYTRGAPDDEALHKSHCARVQRGFEWGKEDERDKSRTNVVEVQSHVRLGSGEVGRIVGVPVTCGGKLGQKLSTYLQTINTVLSAPSMVDEALKASKAYLFLLPSGSSNRELIIGCVIAQHIKYAMAVAAEATENAPSSDAETPNRLVQVDSGLFCHPERLPTPVGIPRIFVSSAYRRKGVAQTLLNAVCKNFIHGCQLDASKGELAFSQPTSLGRAVMETFGKGGIRVFEE